MHHKLVTIKPFHATGLLRYPPKTSENFWFSDVFREYRKRLVAWNGLNYWRHNKSRNYLSTHHTLITLEEHTIKNYVIVNEPFVHWPYPNKLHPNKLCESKAQQQSTINLLCFNTKNRDLECNIEVNFNCYRNKVLANFTDVLMFIIW